MSTTVALVSAAVLAKAALVAALVVQRRKNRIDDEALREQQRLAHLARVAIVGELSGGLAHELNQPLTSILSNAQSARQALAGDRVNLAEVREMLDDIVEDDRRASELIGRLRALLKRQQPAKTRVCVTSLLADAQNIVRSCLASRQVRLEVRVPPDLPPVPGDPIQLQQVLLNLILNACEAVRDCPEARRLIELDAGILPDGRALQLCVADRGRGIAGDGLERVFDAFFTTRPDGIGLGQPICRQIVSAHGGQLWAAHRGGGGAAFHLTLPLTDVAEEMTSTRERSTGRR